MKLKLFIVLSVLNTALLAQNKWQFSVGWATTRTYAKADGKKQVNIQQWSTIAIQPRYSVQWSLNKEKTGLTGIENILRLGVFSLQAEKRIKPGISFATGLETGGRFFDVTEYAMDGRNDDLYHHYANRARRSYLVTSIPLIFKYDVPYKRLNFRCVGGLYLNYEMSVKQNTVFYWVPRSNSFYPALHAGIEINRWNNKGLVFELAYQQGFYDILGDIATVNSLLWINQAPVNVNIASRGSHLRVGLRYNFSIGRIFRRKEDKAKLSTEIPFEGRRISKTLYFTSDSGKFSLCFFDDQTIDNDTITVMYNDSVLFDGYRLTAQRKCVEIDMGTETSAEILIHALNEGSIRPNTLKIEYRDRGGAVKYETLRLGLDNSVKIIIYNRF